MKYPLCMYFADGTVLVVDDEETEAAAKSNGAEYTPAAFGIETCPGETPDPDIAAKRAESEVPADVTMPAEGVPLGEYSREQLIELAANRTVSIDKRWGSGRIREALA